MVVLRTARDLCGGPFCPPATFLPALSEMRGPTIYSFLRCAGGRSRVQRPFLYSKPSSTWTQVPTEGLSQVAGPTDEPLLEGTLGGFFNKLVARQGDRPALVSRHEPLDPYGDRSPRWSGAAADCLRWSYSQFDEHIDQLARGLLQMGIQKGDRVGVFMLNSSSYAALQWATAKVVYTVTLIRIMPNLTAPFMNMQIGAILMCINPAFRVTELLSLLNLVECKALFLVGFPGSPLKRTSEENILNPLSRYPRSVLPTTLQLFSKPFRELQPRCPTRSTTPLCLHFVALSLSTILLTIPAGRPRSRDC
jgi:AMP-binding enzyme